MILVHEVQVARRWFEEVFNEENMDVLADITAADIVVSDPCSWSEPYCGRERVQKVPPAALPSIAHRRSVGSLAQSYTPWHSPACIATLQFVSNSAALHLVSLVDNPCRS